MTSMNPRKWIPVLAVAALMLLSGLANGQAANPVPADVDYQGTLYKADGKTPETGPADIEIRLYTNKDDDIASPIWAESHVGVILYAGVFNVVLGSGNAVDSMPHTALSDVLTGASPVWIGVSVAGEAAERQQRQQLGSAPYALAANSAVNALHGVPPGTIAGWSGAQPPEGWLLCNGATYLRAKDPGAPDQPAYPGLFSAIGLAWTRNNQGAVDDDGKTFRVPSLGGRALVGENKPQSPGIDQNSSGVTPSSARLTTHTLGQLIGEESHIVTSSEMATHSHYYDDSIYGSQVNVSNVLWSNGVLPDIKQDTRTTGSAGGGQAHENMQPSLAVTYIIKY